MSALVLIYTLVFVLITYVLGLILNSVLIKSNDSFEINLGLGLTLQLLCSFVVAHFLSPNYLNGLLILELLLISFNYKKIKLPTLPKKFDLIWIYLIFGFLVCLIPSPYFDPLNYHLAAGKFWIENKEVINPVKSIAFYHNSIFDYLFMYPMGIFGVKSINSLAYAQISSQLIHFFFGIFPSALILKRILRLFDIRFRFELLFLILVFISRGSLQHKAFVAKNDWAAIYLTLLGAYLYLTSMKKSSNVFLAGFLHGLVFSIKFTSILGAIPFLLLGIKKLKKPKIIFSYLLPAGVGASLFLTRNYLWTDNPLFPVFNNLFESSLLSQTWAFGFTRFEGTYVSADLLIGKIYNIVGHQWLNALYFVGFLIRKRELRYLWFYNTLIILFFSLITGPSSELRALGVASALIPMLSLYLVIEIFQRFNIRKYLPLVYLLVLVNIFKTILYSPEQLKVVNKKMLNYFSYSEVSEYILNEFYGMPSSKFLKDKNAIMATNGDLTPYYFSNPFIKIWDYSALDKDLYRSRTPKELVMVLKKYNIRYFVWGTYHFDPYYNPNIEQAIKSELIKCHRCLLGETKENIMVFDLENF
jgi:hypothetical protein